jgi:hypothetical protein
MEVVGIEKARADPVGKRLRDGGLAAARDPRNDDPFRFQFAISWRAMLSQVACCRAVVSLPRPAGHIARRIARHIARRIARRIAHVLPTYCRSTTAPDISRTS